MSNKRRRNQRSIQTNRRTSASKAMHALPLKASKGKASKPEPKPLKQTFWRVDA